MGGRLRYQQEASGFSCVRWLSPRVSQTRARNKSRSSILWRSWASDLSTLTPAGSHVLTPLPTRWHSITSRAVMPTALARPDTGTRRELAVHRRQNGTPSARDVRLSSLPSPRATSGLAAGSQSSWTLKHDEAKQRPAETLRAMTCSCEKKARTGARTMERQPESAAVRKTMPTVSRKGRTLVGRISNSMPPELFGAPRL
mmetsp:Transcript_6434/g.14047  ORF Transcript_6434/g.14047 Transcript_6434/m.14047 type:complete len:200 (+) Transcript_6434:278-877(+)